MDNDKRYILMLAGWYPSRLDQFSGDFIQRHAQSIALFEKVIVLFLAKDPSLPRGALEVHQRQSGNLTEYVVYYSVRGWGVLEGVISFFRFFSLGRKTIKKIKTDQGPPKLVHVCVPWKAGLIALFLRHKYGWNYLITEHWSGYSPKDPNGLSTRSWYVRAAYRWIYARAALMLPVSEELGAQILRWFPGIPYEVVCNVVDTQLFHYVETSGRATIKRCVHVSTMDYPKNIEGILRVVERLVATRDDVEVILVGPYPDNVRQVLTDSGLLNKKVFLTGLISYAEVAALLRESHFLFLFSRYENQPCVLLEALCCGLPVIATRVGGIPEIVDDSNGILVDSEREDQLLDAFCRIMDRYLQYDRSAIAKNAAARFSYAAVGARFAAIFAKYPTA